MEVTGKPLYVLGISKEPDAVVSQSETVYSVPSLLRVNVRSSTDAACKDATSNGIKCKLLNFISQNYGNNYFTINYKRLGH